MTRARELWKRMIFFTGDIRRERCIGGFAWGQYPHLIDYPEAWAATNYSVAGYVGLHRNRGDLSNLAIPGMMKHAWLCAGNDLIEAVSEGVLCRSGFHALMSDYAVILRPKVDRAAMFEAYTRASSMVGCPYDDEFKFDLEIEEELFRDRETAISNMQRYGLGVSCTEMVALCYVGHRRELGLYRTKWKGKQVILPDAYMTTQFEVVWASKHTTLETAMKLGLHEEGCAMLAEYRQTKEGGI